MSDKLQIGLVLPDVLGTYGDTGNAVVLKERAIARGIDAEIINCTLDSSLPLDLDVYVLGGGEDTAQSVAVEYLKKDNIFEQIVNKSTPIFAVSAGMQILGNSYIDSYNRKLCGLGVVDIDTLSKGERFIGEIVSIPILPGVHDWFTGFENHAGVTDIGKDALPLGRVVIGTGNAGECLEVDALAEHSSMADWNEYAKDNIYTNINYFDGAFNGNIVATYMHGPCLARNPELADWLLSKAVGYPLEELKIKSVEDLRRHRFANTLI